MEQFNYTHELESYAIATEVILIAIATLIATIIYSFVSVRIKANYKEIKHVGAFKPQLNKLKRIKRWGDYRKNGEGRYTILFPATSSDAFVAITSSIILTVTIIKNHWYGIYQLCMNIDGTYLADLNGACGAILALLIFASAWSYMLYVSMQFLQFCAAVRLSDSVRKTGEYPYYCQRRSLYFFFVCLKYGTQTVEVKKSRPAEKVCKKPMTMAAMLDADKKTREARCAASLEGFYAKHRLELVSEEKIGGRRSIKHYRTSNRQVM